MDAAKQKRIVELATGRVADRAQGIELLRAADDRALWSEALSTIIQRSVGGRPQISLDHLPLLAAAPADLPEAVAIRESTREMWLGDTVPETLRSLPRLATVRISGLRASPLRPATGLEILASLGDLRTLEVQSLDLGDGRGLAPLSLHSLRMMETTYATLPKLDVESFELGAFTAITTLGAGLPAVRRVVVSGKAELASIEALAGSTMLEDVELRGARTTADFSPLEHAVAGGAPLRRVVVQHATELTNLATFARASKLEHLALEDVPKLATLDHVASLSALLHLGVRGAALLTDVAPVAKLSRLRVLDLRGCAAIGDLTPLVGMPALRVIALAGTAIEPGAAPRALAPYCTWATRPHLEALGARPVHPEATLGAH